MSKLTDFIEILKFKLSLPTAANWEWDSDTEVRLTKEITGNFSKDDNVGYFMEEIWGDANEVESNDVYLEQAPSNADFPHITYSLSNSIDQETREDFILEVNVWDSCQNHNTVELEEITNDIYNGLDEWKYNDGDMQISVYCDNIAMVPDPDEKIRRRRLTYTCQTYL